MPEDSYNGIHVPQETARPMAIKASERLSCPACDYNLTGLTSTRCPECGEPIGVERRRRLSGTEEQSAVPWDRDTGIVGYCKTWWMATFSPLRLAIEFPGRHSKLHANAYTLVSIFLASAIFLVFALPLGDVGGPAILAIILGAAVTLNVSGALFADWTARLTPPTFSPAPYHFWRGLGHYTSGFFIWQSVAGGLAVWGAARIDAGDEDVGLVLVSIAGGLVVLTLLWWYSVLMIMIRRRSRPTKSRMMVYLQPPVLWVFSCLCGTVIAFAIILPLRTIWDFLDAILS